MNKAGDPLAMFLKVFGGDVLTAYKRSVAFQDKHMVRRIPYGKSAQFPTMGLAGSYYHVPGEEILGGQIGGNERVINIEGKLVSPVFIADIDEAMNHFDVRGPYAEAIGQALAKQMDQNVGRVFVNAARSATGNVTGLPGGGYTNQAGFANDGTVLYNGAFDALTGLDIKDVPRDGRFVMFDPTGYALVLKSGKPIDIRYNGGDGANGREAEGTFRMINGAPVYWTNNMPNADDRANALQPASRQHDYSVTKGIVAHSSAAGTLMLQDMTMEGEYDMRRQGHLIIGKYLTGHDKLRVEGAWELRTADPAG